MKISDALKHSDWGCLETPYCPKLIIWLYVRCQLITLKIKVKDNKVLLSDYVEYQGAFFTFHTFYEIIKGQGLSIS